MDAMNSTGGIGVISLVLNLAVVVLQVNQARAVAELKVYMHENFLKRKEVVGV